MHLVPWAQFQERPVLQACPTFRKPYAHIPAPCSAKTGEWKVLDRPCLQGIHSVLGKMPPSPLLLHSLVVHDDVGAQDRGAGPPSPGLEGREGSWSRSWWMGQAKQWGIPGWWRTQAVKTMVSRCVLQAA